MSRVYTLLLLIFMIAFNACEKQVDYSADIKQLKADMLALQKRTDSLTAALASLNNNVGSLNARVDSIRTQITGILVQISQLNTQLIQANANISSINTQIADLNKRMAELLAQLNAIIAQLSSPASSLRNGLVAWYPFTGNANDSSDYANNGTINGVSLTTDKYGRSNRAYSFNGTSNNIDIPRPFFGGTQRNIFTFYTRVYFNSISNSPNIWDKTFFWGEVNFQINSDGSLQFWWANSVTGNKYSLIKSNVNSISTGIWYDLVVLFENSKGRIFVNGVEVPVNYQWVAQGGSILSTTQVEQQCNFDQVPGSSKFGSRITSGITGAYLNGKLDDFRVYDRLLSLDEISFLFRN